MLSITVYCNCYETGKLRIQPQSHWKITVWNDEDGMVDAISSEEPEDSALLHSWYENACPHPEFKAYDDSDFVSLPQAIGMRDEIGQQGNFPILIGNVFESGVHEHWLLPKDLPALREELTRLDISKLSDWAQEVIGKLEKAATAAEDMQKPISF